MPVKQPRGQQTAAHLLNTALELYEREGPHAFTVHAVANAAGVSLGSLYHHFSSFDGLRAALYARCVCEMLDDLAQATVSARTARAGIFAHTVAYLRFARCHTAEARFIHGAAEVRFLPDHAAAIADAKAPHLETIGGWLNGHVRAGRIADLPEPLLEMLIVGPVSEAVRRWLVGDPGADLDEAERTMPERIWRSVRRSRT